MKGKVISEIFGRLGNEMFEIAAAASFAKWNDKEYVGAVYKKNEEPPQEAKDTVLRKVKMNIDHNGYVIFSNGHPNAYLSPSYKIPTDVDRLIISNYLQDPKFIDKDVAFDLFGIYDSINKEIEEKYGDLSDYACVNIRRGDYLLPIHKKIGFKTLTCNDIKEMIAKYFPDDKLLFVSDDIEWCKENFKSEKYYFADKPCNYKPEMDLYLQTKCGKGNIISCSTFSWWGAYLNPNPDKKVVAPYPWFNNNFLRGFKQIYPKEWIKYNTDEHREEN